MRRLWITAGAVWLAAALLASSADQPLQLARFTWGTSPTLGLLAFAITMVWVLPVAAARAPGRPAPWGDIALECGALAAPLAVWIAAASRTHPVAWGSIAYAAALLMLAGGWSRRLTSTWRTGSRRWTAWLAATWAVGIALPLLVLVASEVWQIDTSAIAPLSPTTLAIEAGRGNLPGGALSGFAAPAVALTVGFAALRVRDAEIRS